MRLEYPIEGLSPLLMLMLKTSVETDCEEWFDFEEWPHPFLCEVYSYMAEKLSDTWVTEALQGNNMAGRRLAMLAQDLLLLQLPFPQPIAGFMGMAFDRIRKGENANEALMLNRKPGRQPVLPEDRWAEGFNMDCLVRILMGRENCSRTAAVRALSGDADGSDSTPTDAMRRLWEILARASDL